MNYEPGNCCWATMREQCANRRNSVFVELYGDRMVTAEAARRLNIAQSQISERVRKKGWTHQEAVDYFARYQGRPNNVVAIRRVA